MTFTQAQELTIPQIVLLLGDNKGEQADTFAMQCEAQREAQFAMMERIAKRMRCGPRRLQWTAISDLMAQVRVEAKPPMPSEEQLAKSVAEWVKHKRGR